MVSAKVRRFAEVVGNDQPTASIDKPAWDRWVAWLNGEVGEGRLEFNTARVTYSRAREYVRWLISKGCCTSFDGLDVSANKALREACKVDA